MNSRETEFMLFIYHVLSDISGINLPSFFTNDLDKYTGSNDFPLNAEM